MGADRSADLRAHRLYIVESGKYDVTVRRRGTEVLKTYTTGNYFGELALLYNCPRAATVTCRQPGRLWVLERAVFDSVAATTAKAHTALSTLDSFLMSIDVLSVLTMDERHHLGELLQVCGFVPHTPLQRLRRSRGFRTGRTRQDRVLTACSRHLDPITCPAVASPPANPHPQSCSTPTPSLHTAERVGIVP